MAAENKTKGPVRFPLTIGSVIVITVPGVKTFTSTVMFARAPLQLNSTLMRLQRSVLNEFRPVAVLGLMREHQPRAILRSLLQKLACEKHNRRLENCKQRAEKQRRNQRELDGRRTPAVAAKSVQRLSNRDCCNSG